MTTIVATPRHRFRGRDIIAGVSVALIGIPQSLAYADLAGMPGYTGLYALGVPLIAAALFASSPYLQTGPVATTALLTYGALVPLAEPGSPDYLALAGLLAVVIGVTRIAVGLSRAGWLSYLMSRPLLEGFMSGAAVLIVASQLPGALGANAPRGGVLLRASWTLSHPGEWEVMSLLFAAGTAVIIVAGRRVAPRIPGVLVAAGVGLLYSRITGYAGPTVGDIPTSFPPLTVGLPWSRLPTLVLPGVVIALIGFAEAASISRAFASEDRERWDANREFLSQGAANVAAGLTGGFPVGGSFARSSLNRMAGAGSRWSGLVTGLTVLLFLPFADILSPLPRAVLAGIVIAAVWSLFRPRTLLRIWSVSKSQALIAWGTFALTLALAPHVEHAVLLGVLAAGAVHLLKELRPVVASRRVGGTLHLEPQGVLWFGSAPVLDDVILAALSDEPDVEEVVIHCGGLGRIDLTGAYQLAEMLDQLRVTGLKVELAGVPDHAVRVLTGTGAQSEAASRGAGAHAAREEHPR